MSASPSLAVRPRGQPRTGRLLQVIAAVAAVAVIAGLAAVTIRQQDRIADLQADNRLLVQVVTAADARTVTQPVAIGGQGTIVTSRELGKAVVAMTGLAPLPHSKTYEIWFMSGTSGSTTIRPAGLIGASSDPRLLTVGDADQIGLTVEPKGRSPTGKPTSDPIFTVDLPV